MKIGKRSLGQLINALFARQHYIAFVNIFLVCLRPFACFGRYFLGLGTYPAKIALRTPLGKVYPEIYSYYDMLTVNEIFCRNDYKTTGDVKVAVDFGSNIGISALYFLTRNNFCKCYLFEPDPINVAKLNNNLKDYKDRYELKECAVANESGVKRFGRDPIGRCGGLNRETNDYIDVWCCRASEVLGEILKAHGKIDILKMDIEGSEIEVLKSIDEKLLDKIKNIYFEIDCSIDLGRDFSFHPEIFIHKKYGETYRLINKKQD